MTDKTRRRFLGKYVLNQIGRCLQGFEDGLVEAGREYELDKFFESDESSYALTLAYPDEILLETAKNCGITVENRSRREIAKELILTREDY
jgi:hypothetical protein